MWWAPETLAGRVAWLVLRKSLMMIVGLVLGSRFRSLHRDLTAFRRNPGSGRVAVRLIERALDTEHARSIFNDFRTAPRRVDEAYPYAAMIVRLTSDLSKLVDPDNGTFDDGWRLSRKYEELRKEIDSLTSVGSAFLNFWIALKELKDQ